MNNYADFYPTTPTPPARPTTPRTALIDLLRSVDPATRVTLHDMLGSQGRALITRTMINTRT